MAVLETQVLKRVKPSLNEIQAERALANQLVAHLKSLSGPHVDVQVCGSFARNTHLRFKRDLDIFVLYPPTLSRAEFEKQGLALAKKAFGKNPWKQAFAEHPYIRGTIQGYEVEIVPSYQVERADQLQSAVDRSPFHQAFLMSKLNDRLRDEIRLLRQFLHGIECYGAKLKTSSFPGYLVELLVIHYGSFRNVLKAASHWKKEELLDVSNYWKGREREAHVHFKHHLIVIDPTDKKRNVASALSYNQFARFIAASRTYLKEPSISFFFGHESKPWPLSKIKSALTNNNLVMVRMSFPKNVVADIVYGQLKKFARQLRTQLELNDFPVNRLEEWSDELTEILIVADVDYFSLDAVKKHTGPEVVDADNSHAFLTAHSKIISGPRIEEGRWIIDIPRKFIHVQDFIKDYLVHSLEKPPLKLAVKKAQILTNAQALQLCQRHTESARFLTKFLKGKEEFLDY